MDRKLTPEQRAIIDKLADWTVRRGMTVPAIMLLEGAKPLSRVGSQVLVMFSPVVQLAFDKAYIDAMVELLDDRKNIELLLREIERRDAELQKKKKEIKEQEKALRRQRKEARKLEKQKKREAKNRPGD